MFPIIRPLKKQQIIIAAIRKPNLVSLENCPLLNRINPAALISDALYSLVVYPSYTRFFTNIAGLLLLSALFCLGGLALVRRKKYASL